MFIYYNRDNGRVLDVTPGISQKKVPLDDGVDYLEVPDNTSISKILYKTNKSSLKVENGTLKVDGFIVFTLTGMKEYYEDKILELAESRLHLLRLAQVWYLQFLIEQEDLGLTIDYPISVFNLSTGSEIVLSNGTQLRTGYRNLLSNTTNHLGSIIGRFGTLLGQVKNASSVADFGDIKV